MDAILPFYLVLLIIFKAWSMEPPIDIPNLTKFPFYAQLRCPILGRPGKASRCGGSLLHPKWVLTAASCFPIDSNEIEWLLHQTIQMVFMGSTTMFDFHYGKTNFIHNIYQHPNFAFTKHVLGHYEFSNNIALVRLKTPYELSVIVTNILLCHGFCGCSNGTLIGMGLESIHVNDSFSTNLKYSHLSIQDQSVGKNTTFYIEEENGGSSDGTTGSPFVCTIDSIPVQIGLLSWSIRTKNGIGNTFERTDLFYEFISTHVNDIQLFSEKRVKNWQTLTVPFCNSYMILWFLFGFFIK